LEANGIPESFETPDLEERCYSLSLQCLFKFNNIDLKLNEIKLN